MSRRLVLVLASIGCLASHARASDLLEPPVLSRYLRWGPVRVRPGFAIPVLGYDDNVFSTTDAGSSDGDFVVRLSARLEGLVLFGRSAFVTFKEQLDYTAYQHFHTLNNFDNLGSARVTFPLQRMGFYVDGALNQLKDPPASEVASRPIRRERRGGTGMLFKFGWRSEAEFGLVRSHWSHEDPSFLSPDGFTAAQLLNRTETGTQLRLRYRVTGTTSLSLQTTHRQIRFDDPDVERDSTENLVLPGVEFGEGGRLLGSVRIGWDRLDPTTPGQPTFSTAVGEARLAIPLAGAMTIRIDATRRAGFALYEGNRYYQDGTFELRATRFLNRTLGVEVLGGVGRLSFPEAPQAAARTDSSWRAGPALRVRLPESTLGRRADYSIGIVHLRRDSTAPGLSFSRNLFAVSADVGF